MKREFVVPGVLGLVLLALAVFVESSSIAEGKGYSTDLKELRAEFNRDKGKVRLLLLLSPT